MEPATHLLSRVNLREPLRQVLERVVSDYGLGELLSYRLMERGYEELNISVRTAQGHFVVKIFAKEKALPLINDYVRCIREMRRIGIAAPELRRCGDEYLWADVGAHGATYLCVMEFVDGRHWEQFEEPAEEDLLALTSHVARFHDLNLEVQPNYDSWGTANLVAEFGAKRRWLSAADVAVIEPIAAEFACVNFERLPQGIIHGSLEKANVIKRVDGQLCILDLGCLDRHATVIDLAIYIANFCFGPHHAGLRRAVIDEYQRHRPLWSGELEVLPLAIQASYAMLVIQPSYRMGELGDATPETLEWLAVGREGLSYDRD